MANRLSKKLYILMLAEGLDAIPFLVQVLRDKKEPLDFRMAVMGMLVNMDRWVPYVESPLEAGWFYVPELRVGGNRNLFLDVNGRRIGKEGFDVLAWAAEQTEEGDLRFQARLVTGLLEKDFRPLSTEEQIKRWRNAVRTNSGRGVHQEDWHAALTATRLRVLIIERVPESIPLLVKLLESEKNPYVREKTIVLFKLIDAQRFRLRGSLVGRDAIEAIHRAIIGGNLKPNYGTEAKREELWARLRAQFYLDEFELHPGSEWGVFANAMEIWFGDKTTDGFVNQFVDLKKVSPEFRSFLNFLTKVDPFFPSWEYIFVEPVPDREQFLHPFFRKKVERYHQEWLRFQSSKQNPIPH